MADEDINDPINLIGVGELSNGDFVDKSINFENIDKLISEGGNLEFMEEDKEVDILEEFESSNSDDMPEIEEEDEEATEDHVTSEQIDRGISSYGISDKKNFADDDDAVAIKEEIDDLIYELEETYPKIGEKYQHLDYKSDITELKNTLRYLRRRYDRVRAQNLGKELIISGANLMEFIFDGKRSFGPFTPDLTGWSNTIRPKVRRLQNETATIISDIMNDYKIGPWFRLGIELVPSAIIYSKMRKEQYGKKNYAPAQLSEAFDDLANFE